MLIRKVMIGSTVFIGNEIKVMVLNIDGDIAEIGIEAPKELDILREKEFYEKKPKKGKSV